VRPIPDYKFISSFGTGGEAAGWEGFVVGTTLGGGPSGAELELICFRGEGNGGAVRLLFTFAFVFSAGWTLAFGSKFSSRGVGETAGRFALADTFALMD
jgi:hypothetical protein